jgi:uncharacterized membrane protein YfcA
MGYGVVSQRPSCGSPLLPLTTAILALISGAVVAAFIGATLGTYLSKTQLERLILGLLVGIGCALLVEGFLPQEGPGFLPLATAWRLGAGIGFGLLIGLVSSLLGVAGGELIIPTLVFAFGANIKTAGTASLLISLPTVCVGLLRYYSQGGWLTDKSADVFIHKSVSCYDVSPIRQNRRLFRGDSAWRTRPIFMRRW